MSEKKVFSPPEWLRLDNAGILFPGQNSSSWSNIFRCSVELKDDVDPVVLQQALKNIMPRFPGLSVRMRHGIFWYFLEKNPLDAPLVRADIQNPCYRVKYKESDRFLFRVYYHAKRISVDLFHAITDGYGNATLTFTLVAEYLRLKGCDIPCGGVVKDINEPPRAYELEDSFRKFATSKGRAKIVDPRTYIPRGTRVQKHNVNLTSGTMSFAAVHTLAKSYGVTVTEFFTALLLYIHCNRQFKECKRLKPVAVQVPVNLRNIYPTQTMRNFSICLKVTVDPRLGEYSFEELLQQASLQLRLARDEKKINATITKNLQFEKNLLLRILPLPVKDAALTVATVLTAERMTSAYLSNLGPLKYPQEMNEYIEKVLFTPGPGIHTPARCGIATFGDNLVFTFANILQEADIEREFFTFLVKKGIRVKIESNRK